MKIRALIAAALILGAASLGFAQNSFPDLNVDELREAAKDYRHRAALLRKNVGLRQAGISEAQSRADAAIQAAQADAQARAQQAAQAQAQAASAQSGADAASAIWGMLPGGGFAKNIGRSALSSYGAAGVANANAAAQAAASQGDEEISQANKTAAPLREQANKLEGEKKRLALKADQYEQLADSKDFLITAETLRKQAEEAVKTAGDADKTIAATRSLIQNMDLW